MIFADQPCLADGRVNHCEEAIVLLAHPDKRKLRDAVGAVRIEYDPLPAVFTIEESERQEPIVWGEDNVLNAYWISIRISAASAIGGGLLGFLLAWAAVQGKLPEWIKPTLMTFSGVASNFAGVPLAFAFLATLGRVGLVTVLLKKFFGFDIYSTGFSVLSFAGLTLTYLYFQIPLMVLIVTPALEGLKREWREACDCLGGTAYHYWRFVALPVLWPSILGATLLLFANAFGAVATAYALTGSSLNIVPILLFAQIRGDVLHNPNLGYALALGMIVITGVSNAGYMWLRSRSERGRT